MDDVLHLYVNFDIHTTRPIDEVNVTFRTSFVQNEEVIGGDQKIK